MGNQAHDQYGKQLIRKIAGQRFLAFGPEVAFKYEGGVEARIDGVIRDECAIEIESRTQKQVRGAVLDLFYHPLPKKLLILIPMYIGDSEATKRHCEWLLKEFHRVYQKPAEKIKVVLLKGTGKRPDKANDSALIRIALEELGCL